MGDIGEQRGKKRGKILQKRRESERNRKKEAVEIERKMNINT